MTMFAEMVEKAGLALSLVRRQRFPQRMRRPKERQSKERSRAASVL
jgi:hypothetical protein